MTWFGKAQVDTAQVDTAQVGIARVRRSAALRWVVPVAVAALLVGGTATVTAVTASANSSALPARTAAQLLVDVEQAKLGALSGTIVQTSDLSIPSLPGMAGADSSDLTSLVSGTHTLRVWYDGTDRARVALLGTLGETDVIKNGSDLWTWSSNDNTATHRTLAQPSPATRASGTKGSGTKGSGAKGSGTDGRALGLDPTQLPQTPQEAADAVLQAIDPSTLVSTDGTQTVAGRPVYQLGLRPRATGGSLIASVRIAIDADTHIPLRVQIFAVGHADPAFEVAFSSVDFAAPDAAQFTFNPPPGALVTQIPSTAGAGSGATADTTNGRRSGPADAGAPMATRPEVVGTGWTSVLVGSSSTVGESAGLGSILRALPKVSGSWGSGRLLSGTLFSVVLTDDGRIAVGAVGPDLLYAALVAR